MYKSVIIPGVMRSGTSYLSGVLNAAGIPMGRRPPKTIHMECPDIYKMDVAEIGRQGIPYYACPGVDAPEPAQLESFIQQLTAYKKLREARGGTYGLKEPRIAILLRAYMQVWPDNDTLWIVCKRKPADAADSGVRNEYWSSIQAGSGYIANQYSRCIDLLKDRRVFVFDFDAPLAPQQAALSEALARPIDMVSRWRSVRGPRS